MKTAISVAIIAIAPTSLFAAEPASVAASPSASFLQMLLGLAVVVGLIFAIGWLTRRINPASASNGPIRVVSAASVGPRERVVLVEINDSWLLLGVAPGQVNLLQSMSKASAAVEPARPAVSFMDRLKQATKNHD